MKPPPVYINPDMMATMDWTTIATAGITGLVGLGGIGGGIWQAKKAREASRADLEKSLVAASQNVQATLNAENARMQDSEKRKIYIDFNSANQNMYIIATSSNKFKTTNHGRDLYNDAIHQLWATYYAVCLIAPKDINNLAYNLTAGMSDYADNRMNSRESELPEGYDNQHAKLISDMRKDLEKKS